MKILALLFLLACPPCFAQQKLVEGTVVDQYGKPVTDCKILMGRMCYATQTNASGAFVFKYLPPGRSWTIVIVKPGHQIYSYTFKRHDLPLTLEVKLLPETPAIDFGNFSGSLDDTWEKWGSTFIRSFIGESENARFCNIENPRSLSFHYDPVKSTLYVCCNDMLKITNELLGYRINYRLEKYEYHIRSNSLLYQGVPFFEELDPESMFRKKFEKRRLKAYRGSMQHLIRSIYRGRVAEEGFRIKFTERMIVFDSVRVKKNAFCCLDTLGFRIYKPVYHRTRKLVETTGADLTPADLITQVDSGQYVLSLPKMLYVVYSGEREADQYVRYTPGKPQNKQRSYLYITNADKKISIDQFGYYFPSTELETEGYMSWEKLADQLPLDYEPGGHIAE